MVNLINDDLDQSLSGNECDIESDNGFDNGADSELDDQFVED